MSDIKSIDDLGPYSEIELDNVVNIFNQDTECILSILKTSTNAMAAGHNIDVSLLANDKWKLILNAKKDVTPSRPESHRDWHDVSIYLKGHNDICVGESLQGGEEKEPGNGEWRGGTILDDRVFSISNGDLLFVPAGVPHQNALKPETVFVVLKVKKGEEQKSPANKIIKDWSDVHNEHFLGDVEENLK